MPKFVARRIHIILRTSHAEDWKFCPTDNNPADVATRPLTVKSSIDRMNLWLNGPNIEELITHLADLLHTHTTVHQVRVAPYKSRALTDIPLIKLIDTSPNLYTLKEKSGIPYGIYRIPHTKSAREEFR